MTPRRTVELDAAPVSRVGPRRHTRLSPQDAQLAASMAAFDQSEHAHLMSADMERRRRLASIARDTSKPLEQRCDAVIAGMSLRRVLWSMATPHGAMIHPCDGKHVNANRNAIARLLEVLPRVGLRGVAVGQDVAVTIAEPSGSQPPSAPPPSGRRPLLAADREYQRLRRVALDAVGDLVGVTGPDVQRLGGPLEPSFQQELADLAKDLSWAAFHPSEGQLVRVAIQCAQRARDVAVETRNEGLAVTAWRAAESCVDLGRYAEWWSQRRVGGRS